MPYHMMSTPKTAKATLLGGDGIEFPHFPYRESKYLSIVNSMVNRNTASGRRPVGNECQHYNT
jgi:hypothetical protein